MGREDQPAPAPCYLWLVFLAALECSLCPSQGWLLWDVPSALPAVLGAWLLRQVALVHSSAPIPSLYAHVKENLVQVLREPTRKGASLGLLS